MSAVLMAVPLADAAAPAPARQMLVSDYGPGLDAEGAFVRAFKAQGGQIAPSSQTSRTR